MENEYIIIDEDNTVSKYNLDEKELLNLADNGYIIMRINNGKIEYVYMLHPWRVSDNVMQTVTKFIWKEPELKEGFY